VTANGELLTSTGIDALREGLVRSEEVVFRENGNRTASPETFLQTILECLPRCGISRLGDLSYLPSPSFPVVQACRPDPMFHSSYGQNSGAQGKGVSTVQAKLSASMEAIESFCTEPRATNLVRASYCELSAAHAVIPPAHVMGRWQPKRPRDDEPLMWTSGLWLEEDCEVFLPAETVFFPFLPHSYDTNSFFPCSSDGVASGSSVLEAVIHALYEKIERHYLALWEMGRIESVEVSVGDLESFAVASWNRNLAEGMPLRFWSFLIPGIENLPMVFATRENWGGMGCSSSVEVSVLRAISETAQSQALGISGSREDTNRHSFQSLGGETEPETLTLSQYRERVTDRTFNDLRTEYRFLMKWLHEAGFPMTLVANLTRNGVDVPVVRVVVPGLMYLQAARRGTLPSSEDAPIQSRYPNIANTKR